MGNDLSVKQLKFHKACEKDRIKYVQKGIKKKKININQAGDDSWTPLHRAAKAGNTAVVQCLLEAGADHRAVDKYGWTALHRAADNNCTDAAVVLLHFEADPSAPNEYGRTPLHLAAKWDCMPLMQALVRAGSDINANDEDGQTPLHYACQRGLLSAVECLLDAGGDPRVAEKEGETPLHFATKAGHTAVVHCLLQRGADRSIQDIYGNTPFDWAQTDELKAILRGPGSEQSDLSRPSLTITPLRNSDVVHVLDGHLSDHIEAVFRNHSVEDSETKTNRCVDLLSSHDITSVEALVSLSVDELKLIISSAQPPLSIGLQKQLLFLHELSASTGQNNGSSTMASSELVILREEMFILRDELRTLALAQQRASADISALQKQISVSLTPLA